MVTKLDSTKTISPIHELFALLFLLLEKSFPTNLANRYSRIFFSTASPVHGRNCATLRGDGNTVNDNRTRAAVKSREYRKSNIDTQFFKFFKSHRSPLGDTRQ